MLFNCCFSPINLSYVNLMIRPAKDPRRDEGKTSLSLHFCQDPTSLIRSHSEVLGDTDFNISWRGECHNSTHYKEQRENLCVACFLCDLCICSPCCSVT